MDNILPIVTEHLRDRLRVREDMGEVVSYDAVIILLSYTAVPSLLVSNTLRPPKLIVLYAEKNEKILEDVLPRLDSQISVEAKKIDFTDHGKNLKFIKVFGV